jgi:hypothetical protein
MPFLLFVMLRSIKIITPSTKKPSETLTIKRLKDDYSDDESSFFSNSIRIIMSFEYDEKANPDDSSVHQSVTSAANLSPGISVPSNLSNSTYESEIIDLKKKWIPIRKKSQAWQKK